MPKYGADLQTLDGTNVPCSFWDTRTAYPMWTINLPERCYCTYVVYSMAVVEAAGRAVIVYSLENGPKDCLDIYFISQEKST